ncbi:MAG: hypothetical protein DWQ06_03775 [Calditrichaeota bacterium]|nr:MAG: hypothetical protein DWQ06_03775 [Calditrichota bacterium]
MSDKLEEFVKEEKISKPLVRSVQSGKISLEEALEIFSNQKSKLILAVNLQGNKIILGAKNYKQELIFTEIFKTETQDIFQAQVEGIFAILEKALELGFERAMLKTHVAEDEFIGENLTRLNYFQQKLKSIDFKFVPNDRAC